MCHIWRIRVQREIRVMIYHGILTSLTGLARILSEWGGHLAAWTSRPRSSNNLGVDVKNATSHVRFSGVDDVQESSDSRAHREPTVVIPLGITHQRRTILPSAEQCSLESDENQDWLSDSGQSVQSRNRLSGQDRFAEPANQPAKFRDEFRDQNWPIE